MNFEVGQQLFDGQIVVAFIAPNGAITFEFPQLGSNPGQPFGFTADPNVTFAAVAAAYDEAKAAAGL